MGQAKQDYDVVVIGSGLGGLSAGSLLAHAGYKTLVVEKRDYIGGRWSTEECEGFKLARGGHNIVFGGAVEKVFIETGAKFEQTPIADVWWTLKNKYFQTPPKGGVRFLIEMANQLEVERMKREGQPVKEVPVDTIMNAFRQGFANPEKEAGPTFREWLLQFTESELAYKVFDSISTVVGARVHEITTYEMFQFFIKMGGARGIGTATRGNSVNAEALADVIRAKGDVWLNCPVKEIMVKGSMAKGVVVQKDVANVEVGSRVVISNVGPRATVQLVGENNWGDDEYLKQMRMRLQPTPAIQLYIGSDKPLWGKPGMRAVVQPADARRVIGIVPQSNICPDLAPPGKHLTFIFGGPQSSIHPMDIGYELQQYYLDLDELLPGWRSCSTVLKIDPHNVNDEYPEYRAWPGHGMSWQTPISNLFNVGDGIVASGNVGTAAAAESGTIVADNIKSTLPL
ncbi:phytoene desaturase family protein [Chloroflexota bacterium]